MMALDVLWLIRVLAPDAVICAEPKEIHALRALLKVIDEARNSGVEPSAADAAWHS